MRAPTLVALGGNSLLEPSGPSTVQSQFSVTAAAMVPVADLIERGEHLVITHGNGPQVGFMQLRSELAKGLLHEVPLDSLDADSQGALGYMIQRCLREELERRRLDVEIASLVTEVEVDPKDAAFERPTKPIGKFYSAAEAELLKKERNWQMVEDSKRGYRRVVPSPSPRRIVELRTIRRLVDAGVVVIACGGGGIPVASTPDGHIRGLEAVIDKDLASALLAANLGSKRMFITTGVDAVYADYLDPSRRRALRETTAAELQAMAAKGQFPPGSMGPKIAAALQFLAQGGEEVIICSPQALADAWAGRAGTRIRKENRP